MSYILKNVLSIIGIALFALIVFYPEVSDHLTQKQLTTITAIIVFFLALPIMKIASVLIESKK